MRCKYCGHELNNYADICENCGNFVNKNFVKPKFFRNMECSDAIQLGILTFGYLLLYTFFVNVAPIVFFHASGVASISLWGDLKLAIILVFFIAFKLQRNLSAYIFATLFFKLFFPFDVLFLGLLFSLERDSAPRGF